MPIVTIEPEELLGQEPQVNQITLANGQAGNMQTVDLMREVAVQRSGHPQVRALARNILLSYNTDSQNYIDEALAIGDYVKRKIRYVRDPRDYEQLQDPLLMIRDIRNGTAGGDCDDQALMTATLLLSIGHQPYFRMVRYSPGYGSYNHIYVVVYEKNKGGQRQRIVLDTILKTQPIGTEVPFVSGDEVEV